MSQRFFLPSPLGTETHATLEGPEAHHLLHVMRGKVGDSVVLFDGTGYEYAATIEKLARHQVHLHVDERLERDRELGIELILAVALPRGERQEWLVEKAVELGVTELVPWQTQRSVALPNDKSMARLQRGVIEACKQCGRNRLMQIHEPVTLVEYIRARAETVNDSATNLLVHLAPNALSIAHFMKQPAAEKRWSVCVGVGPEGGFTDQEVEHAQSAGWQVASLGPTILRTETAALAAAATVR